MIEISHRVGMASSEPLSVASGPLRDGAPSPPARADGGEPYRQPYGNASMNSRVDVALGEAAYARKWDAPISDRVRPAFTLRAGDRIVVQGGGHMELFDRNGRSLVAKELGSSGVVLDPGRAAFYAASRNGDFTVYRTADGGEEWNTPMSFGETFARPLLTRQGRHVIMAGVERAMIPHAPNTPNLSVIDVKTVREPLELTSMRELLSVDSFESLTVQSSQFQAAASGESLVFAVPGHVIFAGTDLRIRAAYDADFEPVLLSLDERSRAHLVVRTGEHLELWVVTPAGERQLRYRLESSDRPFAPPVIGHDHRIYLVFADRIVALAPTGGVLWQRALPAAPAGVTVTRDDRLLVSTETRLVAYDAAGAPRVVFDTDGGTLSTPPALADGEIVVATATRLYALARK